MILETLLARDCSETPDRMRLNDLSLRAFEDGADARTLFLALDAVVGHKEAIEACALRMKAGELLENGEWRREAREWFATINPEVDAIGQMIDRIDFPTQTRAVDALRAELSPEAFGRLYDRLGFSPR